MTCAEARRQLSAPDTTLAAEIDAHLDGCAPCRGESDSLKEVDRRLGRLGEVRRGVARAAFLRDPALGRAALPPARPRPLPISITTLAASSASSASASRAQRPGADLDGAAPSIAIGRLWPALCALAVIVPAILWWLLHRRH